MSRQTSTRLSVSTHSRPKAAGRIRLITSSRVSFQHTAARRRLGGRKLPEPRSRVRFNTQPPEGGWVAEWKYRAALPSFNTQPPEGGWSGKTLKMISDLICPVSTHSRPKAAGRTVRFRAFRQGVSTHSRPKAAGQNYS